MKYKILAVIATAVFALCDAWSDPPEQHTGPAIWYTSTMTCQKCGRRERYEANNIDGILSFGDYKELYPDWMIDGTETECTVLCPECK